MANERETFLSRLRQRATSKPTTTPKKMSPLPSMKRSFSAPPLIRKHKKPRKKLMMEDHYRVDPERRVVLPGVPKHADDWARDSHDFFNLVVLIPIITFNVMNWDLERVWNKSFREGWTGEWFDVFFAMTYLYFVVDLLWIFCSPHCVKSPVTIVQHHVATLLYLILPLRVPEQRWLMGACMSVEINTWFLIARRVFNKQGFPPWIIDLSCVSLRIKLISIFFYLTWISIRCLLYPYLLVPICQTYLDYSRQVGTKLNLVLLAVPLHALFCILNVKWTWDLTMSKVRYWRRLPQSRTQQNQQTDDSNKGL